MEIWDFIACILSGLIVCIPLVDRLIRVTKETVRKRNWDKLVSMLADYMAQAEVLIENNAARKEWVIGMIRLGARQIEYELDEEDITNIGILIDQLCTMAKTVNSNTKEATV